MNSTLEYFDFQASVYNEYQRNCVPRYEDTLGLCARFVSRALREVNEPNILDLGCGAGNVTAALRALLPNARFTCLDGSPLMIDAAKEKTPSGEVDYVEADLTVVGWDAPLPDCSYDAVVSLFVLEHLNEDAYRRVLGAVGRVLKPGGWFVAAEGYEGKTNMDAYLEEMERLERSAVSRGILAGDMLREIKNLSSEKETHYFFTMDQKKEWWREAGFDDVNSIWQYLCIGAVAGVRRDT